MSIAPPSLPFEYRNYSYGYTESTGADVYVARKIPSLFRLPSPDTLSASLWTPYGPIHMHGRYVAKHSKGGYINLDGKQRDFSVTVQTGHTPDWAAGFYFGTHMMLIIPLLLTSKTPRSILQLGQTQKTVNHDGSNCNLTKSYHVIMVNRPQKAPTPDPQSLLRIMEHLAA